MPRSPEERYGPEKSPEECQRELKAVLEHCLAMGMPPGKVADVIQGVIQEALATAMTDDDFDGLTHGGLQMMREMSGYADDENEEETDARRQAAIEEVRASMRGGRPVVTVEVNVDRALNRLRGRGGRAYMEQRRRPSVQSSEE